MPDDTGAEPEPEPEPVTESDVDETEAGSAASDPEDESAGSEPSEPSEPVRSARGWLVSVVVLVVLLVGAGIGGGLLAHSVLSYRATTARRAAIMAVATDVAQRSYSLDYRSFPQQSAKIIAETTGNYRQGLVGSEHGLQYILTQGKVASTCVITAAGIERDDPNTASVLLSITSSVTNTQLTTPQVRYYRVAMNLVRQGTQWYVESNDVIA